MGYESIEAARERIDNAANLSLRVAACKTFEELIFVLKEAVAEYPEVHLTMTYPEKDGDRQKLYKVREEIPKLQATYRNLKANAVRSGDTAYIENALNLVPRYARELLRKEFGLILEDGLNESHNRVARARSSKRQYPEGEEIAIIQKLNSARDWDEFMQLLQQCRQYSDFGFTVQVRETKPESDEAFDIYKHYRTHALYSDLVALDKAFQMSLENLKKSSYTQSKEKALVQEWARRVPRKWRPLFEKRYLFW